MSAGTHDGKKARAPPNLAKFAALHPSILVLFLTGRPTLSGSKHPGARRTESFINQINGLYKKSGVACRLL
jgi:hypothetical protein